MTFPTAINPSRLEYLAGGNYAARFYLLVWGNPVIFKAQVNQTSFNASFATITYDQTDASFDTGVYTDVLEGYICYLSETTDIKDSYAALRLRANATATQLEVQFTSREISDDDYIFIVKDVRFDTKHPRDVSGTLYVDYDTTFHLPPPVISGIDTAYLGIITDKLGYYDLVITPSATAVESGATISSWALTLQEGTQIAFNSSTGAATIRYTKPGNYLPRWTVTDSNGIAQWFAPHVFISDESLSSHVNLSILGGGISHTASIGGAGSIPFFDGVRDVLDQTFVAIYVDAKPDIADHKIVFVGNMVNENLSLDRNREAGNIQSATFDINGFGVQMEEKTNFSWVFYEDSTPANFQEIQGNTLWRGVATYLNLMTTLNNMVSLSFDDTTEDYQAPVMPFEESNVLSAVSFVMERNKSQFDFHPSGPLRMVRNALFQDTADRNALTTVADWKRNQYTSKGEGGRLWALSHAHQLLVSRALTGGGWYNSTSDDINTLLCYVPGIVGSGGQENIEINGQLLARNLTEAQARTELKTRSDNAFAASQDVDMLPVELPDIFATILIPSVSAWHTFEIDDTDNLRGKQFTSSIRWLLMDMAIDFLINEKTTPISTVFRRETSALGFSSIIVNPPQPANYPVPVLPHMPSVKGFSENLGNMLPTGAQSGVDDQPITKSDTDKTVAAQDPLVPGQDGVKQSATHVLSAVIVWSNTKAYLVDGVGKKNPPDIIEQGLNIPAGHTIKHAALDVATSATMGAYIISNNGNISSPETRVYRNRDVIGGGAWETTDLTDMLGTFINVSSANSAILLGKFAQYTVGGGVVSLLGESVGGGPSGNGQGALYPYTFTTDPHPLPVSIKPGVYDSVNDWFSSDGTEASDGGKSCDIAWPVPPGLTITRVRSIMRVQRISGDGEKTLAQNIDDVSYDAGTVGGATFGSGTSPQVRIADSGAISVSDPGLIQFHVSKDGSIAQGYARITGIRIEYTSVANAVGTRYTSDFGGTFEPAKSIGQVASGEGAITRRLGQAVLAAKDGQVKKALLAGWPYTSNADQGATPGQYAMALQKFHVAEDYMLAPDGGSVGLYKIVSDSRSDITPNDGANDGFAINQSSIGFIYVDDQPFFFLSTYGGTTKLADTYDQGDNWSFNTNVTNNASWLAVNRQSPATDIQVFVADDTSLLYFIYTATATSTLETITMPETIQGVAAL
jgi:hypothetical protein